MPDTDSEQEQRTCEECKQVFTLVSVLVRTYSRKLGKMRERLYTLEDQKYWRYCQPCFTDPTLHARLVKEWRKKRYVTTKAANRCVDCGRHEPKAGSVRCVACKNVEDRRRREKIGDGTTCHRCLKGERARQDGVLLSTCQRCRDQMREQRRIRRQEIAVIRARQREEEFQARVAAGDALLCPFCQEQEIHGINRFGIPYPACLDCLPLPAVRAQLQERWREAQSSAAMLLTSS